MRSTHTGWRASSAARIPSTSIGCIKRTYPAGATVAPRGAERDGAGYRRVMPDLGGPASYLTLADGTPVLSCDGEQVGTVAHVLADAGTDIFDGLVLDTDAGRRFADAPLVAEVHARGVVLSVDGAAVARLPEPSANPAAIGAGPDDVEPSDLGDKLRRAWDLVSGKG